MNLLNCCPFNLHQKSRFDLESVINSSGLIYIASPHFSQGGVMMFA